MQRLRDLLILSSAVTTALLALALPVTAATAATGPQVARMGQATSPTAGGSNDTFYGDSCTSDTFCMAVGAYTLNGNAVGLSEKLSGSKWVAESVPSPSQAINAVANAVSCASPASCLLVGDHYAGQPSLTTNLAEAWNGSSWRIVTVTGPAGSGLSDLSDVACPAASLCLAVGWGGTVSGYQDTAYTWTNHTTWHQITVPRPHGAHTSELSGLSCFNTMNCMAVGNYTNAAGNSLPFAARWHDGRWTLLTPPPVANEKYTILQGVSCPTATMCMAAGYYLILSKNQFLGAVTEIWTAGKWRVSKVFGVFTLFHAVSCPAPDRCFAVGYSNPPIRSPLIETWNGRKWAPQHPAPGPAAYPGSDVFHASCVTRSRCEAVGYRYDPNVSNSNQTMAEFWNGHRWIAQTTANP